MLGVPLVKDGKVIGAIVLYRAEVRAFDDQQIALLSSFAAQAVIAIENARLLADLQERQRELARSVEELKSLGEVSQTVNSSLELDKVLPPFFEHACAMAYAGGGTIYVFDKTTGEFHLAAGHNMSEEHIAAVRAQPMRLGSAVVGECAERREAVQIADLEAAPRSPMLDILRRAGVRAVLAVPLLHQSEVIGALVVRRNHPGAFSAEIIRLLEAFAAQSAVAVHNARLFKEVEETGRALALASQHKSQFVANMSHELRTPLAAILGYAELLKEGIYGGLPDKSTPIVGRIQSNGTHLLGSHQHRARPLQDRGGTVQLEHDRVCARQHGRERARGDRIACRGKEAGAQDGCRQGTTSRPRRRAAPHAGAAQSGRQRHQVHGCGRGADRRRRRRAAASLSQ